MAHYFTVEEANALLPRLVPMVERLQAQKREVDACETELADWYRLARSNGHHYDQSDVAATQKRLNELIGEMNQLVEQIQALGCELKDADLGLLDFPSRRNGRPIYLCWRLGEPEVAHWHELDAGYAGRQPL